MMSIDIFVTPNQLMKEQDVGIVYDEEKSGQIIQEAVR
jgi:hypothetical protein